MNPSSLTLLLESITNLGNRLFAIENELITYMEANPKPDNEFVEQRLRALEDQVKTLRLCSVSETDLKEDLSARDENIYAELASLKEVMDKQIAEELEEKLNG